MSIRVPDENQNTVDEKYIPKIGDVFRWKAEHEQFCSNSSYLLRTENEKLYNFSTNLNIKWNFDDEQGEYRKYTGPLEAT